MSLAHDLREVSKPQMPDKKRLKKMFSWTDDGV